ncbi:MAG TPA: DUF6111 family protein [Stellaceae bacterium]|nr:DUF6111 family protein [Stellaceae bacterium]
MTRAFLTIVVPLLLPTALYALWVLSIGRTEPAAEWRTLPWVWLAGAGAALAAIVFVAVVQIQGTREGSYIPPHLENGKVVPGQVVPQNGNP